MFRILLVGIHAFSSQARASALTMYGATYSFCRQGRFTSTKYHCRRTGATHCRSCGNNVCWICGSVDMIVTLVVIRTIPMHRATIPTPFFTTPKPSSIAHTYPPSVFRFGAVAVVQHMAARSMPPWPSSHHQRMSLHQGGVLRHFDALNYAIASCCY